MPSFDSRPWTEARPPTSATNAQHRQPRRTVVEPEETTDDGQSAGLELSGLTVSTTVFVLIAIVGLFAAFAPKRIRKISESDHAGRIMREQR